MNCPEFQSRLRTAIEQHDAEAPTSLAAHGEQCPDAECQRLWRDHELLTRAVAQWRDALPCSPSHLANSVLHEVLARSPASDAAPSTARAALSSSRRGRLASVAAVAAALLLALAVVRPGQEPIERLAHRGGDGEPSRVIAAGADESASTTGERSTTTSSDANRPESYVGYAQKATYFVTDLAMLVVPVSADEGDEQVAGQPDWIESLEERIEPVRSNVTHKFGEWFGRPNT